MIKTIKQILNPFNFVKMGWLNKIFTLILLVYTIAFSTYSLIYFPPLQVQSNLYGFTTDFINLMVIVFLFWMVQCSGLSKLAYLFSSAGLLFWAMGNIADVIDELVVQPYWVSVYFEDLFRTSGMLLTSYGLFKTMRFMQSIRNKLFLELTIDDLTKVSNRRYFYQYAKNISVSPYTILIIDIDHFKSINDDFGHDMGDKILKELAGKFNSLFLEQNVFSRLGGEEFGGYLPTSNMAEVANFTQQLISLAQTIHIKNNRFLTVSIGVALQKNDELLDQVMKRADLALYTAKKNGRNRVEIHS